MIKSTVCYLTNPYQLIFKDEIIDDENIESGFILCETLVSIISPGTEIAAYVGAQPLRPGNAYPRLVGYCNVARVIKVGPNVSSVSVGDRVLTGACHCSHFLILESNILATVSDKIESRYAACAYLFQIGYDAVIRSGLKQGSSVVVLGLGVLGLGSVAMSSRLGANVYGISDYLIPTEIAKKFGANEIFNRKKIEDLKMLLGNRLADVVISTSNSWSDWDLALQIAGKGSFIGVIGFPGRDLSSPKNNPLDSQYFYDKQLKIQAVGHVIDEDDKSLSLKYNMKDNLSFILSEMERGYLNPELLISNMFSWSKLENAYKNLIKRVDSPITFGLEWKN